MSNNRDRLDPVSRAAIAGALVGASASCVREWQRYQQGDKTLNHAATHVIKDTVKASAISAGVMAVANATAGRPTQTLLAILGISAASLYVMDAMTKRGNDESA